MTQSIETAGVEGRRLFDRDFTFWYLSRSIFVVGTAASAVALPLLVYRTSASPTLTAAVVGLEALPYLLFGLFAGAAADRLRRKHMMGTGPRPGAARPVAAARPDGAPPKPFPVAVRPARICVEPHGRATRPARAAANHAHVLTKARRDRTWYRPALSTDASSQHGFPEVHDVIRDAVALAADPLAGVRIGRDPGGRVVMAVLHAAAWSIRLVPAKPHPRAWLFLDSCGGRDFRFWTGG